jgi:hypothetical protein
MHSPTYNESAPASLQLLAGQLGPPLDYQVFRAKLLAVVTPTCTFADDIRTLLTYMKADPMEVPQQGHVAVAVIVVSVLATVAVVSAGILAAQRSKYCSAEDRTLLAGDHGIALDYGGRNGPAS